MHNQDQMAVPLCLVVVFSFKLCKKAFRAICISPLEVDSKTKLTVLDIRRTHADRTCVLHIPWAVVSKAATHTLVPMSEINSMLPALCP